MCYQDHPNSTQSETSFAVQRKCPKNYYTPTTHSFQEKCLKKSMTLYPVQRGKTSLETWTQYSCFNISERNTFSPCEDVATRCRILNTNQTTEWRHSTAHACMSGYAGWIFWASSSANNKQIPMLMICNKVFFSCTWYDVILF